MHVYTNVRACVCFQPPHAHNRGRHARPCALCSCVQLVANTRVYAGRHATRATTPPARCVAKYARRCERLSDETPRGTPLARDIFRRLIMPIALVQALARVGRVSTMRFNSFGARDVVCEAIRAVCDYSITELQLMKSLLSYVSP